jgi:hypothetical protein
VGQPLEPPYEGKALKSEPQECFSGEINRERESWKYGREGGEEPQTWQWYSGMASPGDVAGSFYGAEEVLKTQERRLPRRGAKRGESNTLEEVERHERMFRLIASIGTGVTEKNCRAQTLETAPSVKQER